MESTYCGTGCLRLSASVSLARLQLVLGPTPAGETYTLAARPCTVGQCRCGLRCNAILFLVLGVCQHSQRLPEVKAMLGGLWSRHTRSEFACGEGWVQIRAPASLDNPMIKAFDIGHVGRRKYRRRRLCRRTLKEIWSRVQPQVRVGTCWGALLLTPEAYSLLNLRGCSEVQRTLVAIHKQRRRRRIE